MKRAEVEGEIQFTCFCGVMVEGGPEDALISELNLKAEEVTEMYRSLLRHAAWDPTNQRVKKDCPVCGLDYMIQVRATQREVIVYVCTCGYTSADRSALSAEPR